MQERGSIYDNLAPLRVCNEKSNFDMSCDCVTCLCGCFKSLDLPLKSPDELAKRWVRECIRKVTQIFVPRLDLDSMKNKIKSKDDYVVAFIDMDYDVASFSSWFKIRTSVIWLLFIVLYLLCCISKYIWWDINKNLIWESDVPSFNHGHQKCMFVDSFTKYISHPNYIHYWVWNIKYKLKTLSEYYSNLEQLNFGVPIRFDIRPWV